MSAILGKSAAAGLLIDGSAGTSDTTIVAPKSKEASGSSDKKVGAKPSAEGLPKSMIKSFSYAGGGADHTKEAAGEEECENYVPPNYMSPCLKNLVSEMQTALTHARIKEPLSKDPDEAGANLLDFFVEMTEKIGLAKFIKSDPAYIVPTLDAFLTGRKLVSLPQRTRLQKSIEMAEESISRSESQSKESHVRYDMAADVAHALQIKLDQARGTESELEAQMNLVKANQIMEDVLASTEKRLAALLRTQDQAAQYEIAVAKHISDDIYGANVDLQKNIDKQSLGTSMVIQFVGKVNAYCSTKSELSLILNVLTECPFTGKQVKPLHSGNLLLIWGVLLEKYRDKGNKAKVMVMIVNTVRHFLNLKSSSLRPVIDDIQTKVIELQNVEVYNLSISDLLGAIVISLSDEDCLRYYQSTMEILELSENSGKGEHSQLGQNKIGDDGREAPNIMPILKHMCEMQARNQFMNKSVKEFKSASHKSSTDTKDTKKQEAKEQKVLTIADQTALITKAITDAFKPKGAKAAGGGAAKDSAKDSAKDKSDKAAGKGLCKYGDRCFGKKDGTCPLKHVPGNGAESAKTWIPDQICSGWMTNVDPLGRCNYELSTKRNCRNLHPSRPGKPEHTQVAPSSGYKDKKSTEEKIDILTVDSFCGGCSMSDAFFVNSGTFEARSNPVMLEFGSEDHGDTRDVSASPTHESNVLPYLLQTTNFTTFCMDLSQVPLASAKQEAMYSHTESLHVMYDIPEDWMGVATKFNCKDVAPQDIITNVNGIIHINLTGSEEAYLTAADSASKSTTDTQSKIVFAGFHEQAQAFRESPQRAKNVLLANKQLNSTFTEKLLHLLEPLPPLADIYGTAAQAVQMERLINNEQFVIDSSQLRDIEVIRHLIGDSREWQAALAVATMDTDRAVGLTDNLHLAVSQTIQQIEKMDSVRATLVLQLQYQMQCEKEAVGSYNDARNRYVTLMDRMRTFNAHADRKRDLDGTTHVHFLQEQRKLVTPVHGLNVNTSQSRLTPELLQALLQARGRIGVQLEEYLQNLEGKSTAEEYHAGVCRMEIECAKLIWDSNKYEDNEITSTAKHGILSLDPHPHMLPEATSVSSTVTNEDPFYLPLQDPAPLFDSAKQYETQLYKWPYDYWGSMEPDDHHTEVLPITHLPPTVQAATTFKVKSLERDLLRHKLRSQGIAPHIQNQQGPFSSIPGFAVLHGNAILALEHAQLHQLTNNEIYIISKERRSYSRALRGMIQVEFDFNRIRALVEGTKLEMETTSEQLDQMRARVHDALHNLRCGIRAHDKSRIAFSRAQNYLRKMAFTPEWPGYIDPQLITRSNQLFKSSIAEFNLARAVAEKHAAAERETLREGALIHQYVYNTSRDEEMRSQLIDHIQDTAVDAHKFSQECDRALERYEHHTGHGPEANMFFRGHPILSDRTIQLEDEQIMARHELGMHEIHTDPSLVGDTSGVPDKFGNSTGVWADHFLQDRAPYNQHTELLRAVYDQRLETYIKIPRTLVQDYNASQLFEFLERFIPLYVDFEVWDEDEVGELFPLTYTITPTGEEEEMALRMEYLQDSSVIQDFSFMNESSMTDEETQLYESDDRSIIGTMSTEIPVSFYSAPTVTDEFSAHVSTITSTSSAIPIVPQIDSTLFDTDSSLHILYEQESAK